MPFLLWNCTIGVIFWIYFPSHLKKNRIYISIWIHFQVQHTTEKLYPSSILKSKDIQQFYCKNPDFTKNKFFGFLTKMIRHILKIDFYLEILFFFWKMIFKHFQCHRVWVFVKIILITHQICHNYYTTSGQFFSFF